MDPYIGKLLDNRYEILELVGTGGMAKVYKARCHRLNRLVAIKILREDLAQDAEFRRRFHDESQAIAMLSHPNIVAVYDVSRSSELEYIVMELIDGITLKQYMQKKGNKLNWREALHFITQIAKGLSHAHSRGIIHRDIKPHNIMVLRDGSVKVSDFGIARVASGGHSTLTQEALGSVHYISPEQARGSHIDNRSDLYSAGVVLYEMLTGRLPFEGDTPVSVAIQHISSIPLSPRELEPSIPEALEVITMKAMAPNPDNRYLTADEMLADLEEFRKNPSINFDYSASEFHPEEEADDDRTRRVVSGRAAERYQDGEEYAHQRRGSRWQEEEAGSRRNRRYEEDEEDDLPRRGPIWPIFLAVAAVLLFVGMMVSFLWNTIFAGLLAPPVTDPVPRLIGEVYEEVKDNSELLGRFTLVEGETVADDATPGTIIDQEPKAGKEVGENITEITVTISGGPDTVEMISLVDLTYSDAVTTLRGIGLRPAAPEYENHETIEQGHVISHTPMKGDLLPPGTEVTIIVSKGPKVEEFQMPNLVDMTKARALAEIDNKKLKEGYIREEYDDEVDKGKVVSQYPLKDTMVSEGTEVNLIISLGPDPATLPPDPPPVDPVRVTKIVTVELEGYEGTVSVSLLMDGEIVGSGTGDPAMDTAVSIPLPGSTDMGVKDVAVYINGELAYTTTVNFGE